MRSFRVRRRQRKKARFKELSVLHVFVIVGLHLIINADAVDRQCDEIKIGDLVVVDNPVHAEKVANTKLTSLQIHEEKESVKLPQYLGSLTCHVFRNLSTNSVFDHFVANSSTVFRSANAYDPYIFGKKTHRILTCDIYLRDTYFNDPVVDLEIVLILQPLLENNHVKNPCDVPVIAKQVVRIIFDDNYRGTASTRRPLKRITKYPFPWLNERDQDRRPDLDATTTTQFPWWQEVSGQGKGGGNGGQRGSGQNPSNGSDRQRPSGDRDGQISPNHIDDRDRKEEEVRGPNGKNSQKDSENHNVPGQQSTTNSEDDQPGGLGNRQGQKGSGNRDGQREKEDDTDKNVSAVYPKDTEGEEQDEQVSNTFGDQQDSNDSKGERNNEDYDDNHDSAKDDESKKKDSDNRMTEDNAEENDGGESSETNDKKEDDRNKEGDGSGSSSVSGDNGILDRDSARDSDKPETVYDDQKTTPAGREDGQGQGNGGNSEKPERFPGSLSGDENGVNGSKFKGERTDNVDKDNPNENDQVLNKTNEDRNEKQGERAGEKGSESNEEVNNDGNNSDEKTFQKGAGNEETKEDDTVAEKESANNKGKDYGDVDIGDKVNSVTQEVETESNKPNRVDDTDDTDTTDGNKDNSNSRNKGKESNNNKVTGGKKGNKASNEEDAKEDNYDLEYDSITERNKDFPFLSEYENDLENRASSESPVDTTKKALDSGNENDSKDGGEENDMTNESLPEREDEYDDIIGTSTSDYHEANENGISGVTPVSTTSVFSVPYLTTSIIPDSSESDLDHNREEESKNNSSSNVNEKDEENDNFDKSTKETPLMTPTSISTTPEVPDKSNAFDSEDTISQREEGNETKSETSTEPSERLTSSTIKSDTRRISPKLVDITSTKNVIFEVNENLTTQKPITFETTSTLKDFSIKEDTITSSFPVASSQPTLTFDITSQSIPKNFQSTTPNGISTKEPGVTTDSNSVTLRDLDTDVKKTIFTGNSSTEKDKTGSKSSTTMKVSTASSTTSLNAITLTTILNSGKRITSTSAAIEITSASPGNTRTTTPATAGTSSKIAILTTSTSISPTTTTTMTSTSTTVATTTRARTTTTATTSSTTVATTTSAKITTSAKTFITTVTTITRARTTTAASTRTTSTTMATTFRARTTTAASTRTSSTTVATSTSAKTTDASTTKRKNVFSTDAPAFSTTQITKTTTNPEFISSNPKTSSPALLTQSFEPSSTEPSLFDQWSTTTFGNFVGVDVTLQKRNRTTRIPRIIPDFTDSPDGFPGGIGNPDEKEKIVENRIFIDGTSSSVTLAPSQNTTEQEDVSPIQKNASLFWSMLVLAIILALILTGIIIYYCCPGLCPCCGECLNRNKELRGSSGQLDSGDGGESGGDSRQLTTTIIGGQSHGRKLTQANGHVASSRNHSLMQVSRGLDPIDDHEALDMIDVGQHRRAHHLDPISGLERPPGRGYRINGRNQRRLSSLTDVGDIRSGDRVLLVEERPRSSPILVRVLRAVTPRFGRSAEVMAATHGRPHYGRQDSRGSRVFQLVKDHIGGRRSNQMYGGDFRELEEGRNSHGEEVQIMSLDEQTGAPFIRDGNTEILQLEDRVDIENEEEGEEDEAGEGYDAFDGRPNTRDFGHDVQLRVDENQSDFERYRSGQTSRLTDITAIGSTADTETDVKRLVDTENKTVQTDLTYSKASKKSQTMMIHMDDSDSEDDPDIANQSLSQSMIASMMPGMRSFNDPGFLNVAMQTLVNDDYLKRHHGGGGDAASRVSQGHPSEDEEDIAGSEFERSHRSLFSYPGRVGRGGYFSRHHQGRHQQETISENPHGPRKFSKPSKKHHHYNYYNGNRTPPSPSYAETKASILRRRTINTRPPEVKLGRKMTFGRNRPQNRSTLAKPRLTASMTDLTGLIPDTDNDPRRASSTDTISE